MESNLKGEIFKNSLYQKKYDKDFLTKKLIENSIIIDTPQVSGVINELQLNGMFIVSNNMNAPKGYSIKVFNNFPMFKLHFEIAGNYSYTPEGQHKPVVQIPDFHYNMFYLPRTKGLLEYKGTPRRTFEIIFTLGLIKKLAGSNYNQILKKIDNVIKKDKPFVFWKQPRAISPEFGQFIEEIIACPFAGHLKKTYLESKITTLLVDVLIEANKHPKPYPEVNLSQTDIISLRTVEHHIKSNLNKILPIKELAIIAGFNGSKLKRDFKQVYGTTIFKYITKLRMEKASELIYNENFTIAQAAYEVGYTNPQHFTNAFKRTLGYLPSKLKK